MNKTLILIHAAFTLALGAASLTASAATIPTFPMTIMAGVPTYDGKGNAIDIASGSWFAMDTNGNSLIAGTEKTALSQGYAGLVIGSTTSPGASHAGVPAPGDINAITAPWAFFGNTGSDYLTAPITGNTTAGLDFSGWSITWNGIPSISLGGGAWGAGFSDGIAHFVWNSVGLVTIDYHATVPLGDSSGFGGTQYALHLEGYFSTPEGVVIPSAIPEVSTCAMMLAGLVFVALAMHGRRTEKRCSQYGLGRGILPIFPYHARRLPVAG